MRIRFDHPAVVSGEWHNGDVRRELVRVAADFEIKELSEREAPRSFTVDVNGTVLSEYRMVGGRHYKKWIFDQQQDIREPASNLMKSLYTGANIDFPVLTDILKSEIRETRKLHGPAQIENTERSVLKRELQDGFDSRAIALLKAPHFKKWQWLGRDADAEIADWRERTAGVFDKIILVDGCPHLLSYEPCYRLVHAGTSQPRRGPAELVPHDVAVYGKTLKDRQTEANTGLETLGYLGLVLGAQFFAASDMEGIATFAEASGWGMRHIGQTIVIHNEAEPFGDFMELETVRHARIVLDGARVMIGQVKGQNHLQYQYHGRQVDKLAMQRKMECLRQAIVAWQDERNGIDGLVAPFEDLWTEIVQWDDGRPKRNAFELEDQVKAFRVREDLASVNVVTVPWISPLAGREP
ncbi:hypothetical protein [Rhizobium sp. BK176]|uniref:hypothetical protein n=1 Tax=Rhizobium sp. BK176 TaxID=2587071 RepID=UPI0021680A76|nr:hypothetical protein [Rhizobium sp. BK176]MCS4089206.1 hypothetical protein [Rhizobium sp. BK176]